ncbi:MAG: hypothetical protein IJG31_07490 [Fusobacterium sp.]|nr:hypothetical protein [Fusobacterium sp.]
MRADVRDAINVINRYIQEIRYIDVSDGTDNVVARILANKEEDFIAEVFEHMNLIMKEISKIHNEGSSDEHTEKYFYLSDKIYMDIDEFKRDFLSS